MAETGCLKDGHFQNLEVESVITNSNDRIQIGDFVLGKAITHKTVKGSFDSTIRSTMNLPQTPFLVFRQLQLHLASLIDDDIKTAPKFWDPQNAIKLGFAAGVAGVVAIASGGDDQTIINASKIRLINDTTVAAKGVTAPGGDALADGEEALIVFGTENTCPDGSDAFTIELVGDNAAQTVASGTELVKNNTLSNLDAASSYDRIGTVTSNNKKLEITFGSSGGNNIINKGSFIYLLHDGGSIVIKACIISTTTLLAGVNVVNSA